MRRREFITLLGGAASAWPVVPRAQQGKPIKRVSFLTLTSVKDEEGVLATFRDVCAVTVLSKEKIYNSIIATAKAT